MSVPTVAVVGHPFGPLGISRVVRCSFASFRAAGVDAKVFDIWRTASPDPAHAAVARHLTDQFGEFNLFHLNGDEIEEALDHLGGLPRGARNVIYPMWELPRYPDEWARQLDRFDEIWAGSRFIADSIRPAVSVPVVHMPLATEAFPRRPRSRRYFGIPESAYAFLFFFDMRSYVERKNPTAVLAAFARLLERRPWAQACLVLKVHGTEFAPSTGEEMSRQILELGSRAVMIDRQMDEDDTHALIYNCDAFVSLHRAEGYGLGLAEAMSMGKPVVGTAYSGNMDFMNDQIAHLVGYELVPVAEGAYPHWDHQLWAEPRLEEATNAMITLLGDPGGGRRMGRAAAQHMRAHFSFRAAGLRYVSRVRMRHQK